jgi:hypothetical protein
MRHRLTALPCIVTTAALLALPAQASVEVKAKPQNRLAAKVSKPAPAAAPEEDQQLSEAQLAAAHHVHQGEAQCEFNQKVSVTPHPDKPGRFRLQFNKMVYNLSPEPTTTGAVRLEDNSVRWPT